MFRHFEEIWLNRSTGLNVENIESLIKTPDQQGHVGYEEKTKKFSILLKTFLCLEFVRISKIQIIKSVESKGA